MIILPDRNIPRARLLMPIPERQWSVPSLAQPKDYFGCENTTLFRVRARLHDGHVVWCGLFRDRADFDAFLWAIAIGSLRYERELWDLPTPAWRPGLGEMLSYDFATLRFLTSGAGSNQTFTSPVDWVAAGSAIDSIAGGASGGAGRGGATRLTTGGGGGAWNETTGFSFATPGTTTATYQIGLGGAAVVISSNSSTAGNNGGDTWFNGTTLAGSTVGSKQGVGGGSVSVNGNLTGSAGGAGASGKGTTSNDGGRGGTIAISGANYVATGAGGAAGSSGAGTHGDDISSPGGAAASAGGSGDAGIGGTAGTTGGGTGGNGAEWDGSHGSGGGGGGLQATAAGGTAGSGGNYGAGGGGISANTSTVTSGAGIQGVIFISYVPAVMGLGGLRVYLRR